MQKSNTLIQSLFCEKVTIAHAISYLDTSDAIPHNSVSATACAVAVHDKSTAENVLRSVLLELEMCGEVVAHVEEESRRDYATWFRGEEMKTKMVVQMMDLCAELHVLR